MAGQLARMRRITYGIGTTIALLISYMGAPPVTTKLLRLLYPEVVPTVQMAPRLHCSLALLLLFLMLLVLRAGHRVVLGRCRAKYPWFDTILMMGAGLSIIFGFWAVEYMQDRSALFVGAGVIAGSIVLVVHHIIDNSNVSS